MIMLEEIRKEMLNNGHAPGVWDLSSVEGFNLIHCLGCHGHVIVCDKEVSVGGKTGRVLGIVNDRCSISHHKGVVLQ